LWLGYIQRLSIEKSASEDEECRFECVKYLKLLY